MFVYKPSGCGFESRCCHLFSSLPIQDYYFKILLENKLFTEKNGILIKEREQQAIVGHTLLEKRVRRMYILYKSEYSHECIYITKYFLLIFYVKHLSKNVQIQLKDGGENKKNNQTRKLPASNSFNVSMLISVEYFSIDKMVLICWNLYLQQLFSQHLEKVLVMKWWKIDNKYKCATTLNSFNKSNEITRLKWLFQVVHI